MSTHRNSRQGGFTLAEVAVASLIFMFIAVVAYTALNQGNQAYRRGDQSAEMQQRTRLAFDQMMIELRMAGFDYNRDGDANEYPDHPDEQLEWIGPTAIVFRGNLDYSDANGGREPAYEADPTDALFPTLCCPIVTTGNDEIVGFALRSDDPSKNTGSLVLRADTSIRRDGGFGAGGAPTGEEEVTISNIDLTTNNPPYSLIRFSLNDAGAVTERPVATNIRSLGFTYQGEDGQDVFCMNPAADGTCPTGQSVAFAAVGGADDVNMGDQKGRSARAAVRRIVARLVGMTEQNFRNYRDGDTAMPSRPKLALEAAVVPQNLGIKGTPDLDDARSEAPTNVTLCAGQCNTVRVEWQESRSAVGYLVKLFVNGQTTPFFTGATPGIAVPGSSPSRAFAYFQRTDAPELVNGASVYARVAARMRGEQTSEDSAVSAAITLTDVVRPSAPTGVSATGFDKLATGWPAVDDNLIPPDTLNASGNGSLQNGIRVSWTAPAWALQVTNRANAATTWTTAAGAGQSPLECDQEHDPASGSGSPIYRTRLRENFGTVRYLVFRSTNPRFVPTNADFVAATQGTVDPETGLVSFLDRTTHVYRNGVFNSTSNALENCRTYYYRVRAVDDCWNGSNPAGPSSLQVSAFAPPLNTDASATDSDDISLVNPASVGVAIPGYSVPKAVPRRPESPRFNTYDSRTDDGDGRDATIAFEASKLDGTLAPDGVTPAYEDIVISEYRVYSHATLSTFGIIDMKAQTNGVRLDKVIQLWDLKAGRIAYDDENNDGTIQAGEDESITPAGQPTATNPKSGLRIDLDPTASRWYKVVPVQCRNEDAYPSGSPDDFDFGTASVAIKFPCDFGGGPFSTISQDTTNFPTSASSDANMENPVVSATRARLVIKDRTTGDRSMTPPPGKVPTLVTTGVWRATFNSTEIAALTDNFGAGNYIVSFEWDDANGCLGFTDGDTQQATPPSCCLQPGSPVMTKVTNTRVTNSVSISCGAQSVRFMSFTVTVDNANGGPQERFSNVAWDDPDAADDRTWSSNATSATFDTTANPSVLTAGQTGVLIMDFNRAVGGDNVTVTYNYKIAGTSGSCTYTMRIP